MLSDKVQMLESVLLYFNGEMGTEGSAWTETGRKEKLEILGISVKLQGFNCFLFIWTGLLKFKAKSDLKFRFFNTVIPQGRIAAPRGLMPCQGSSSWSIVEVGLGLGLLISNPDFFSFATGYFQCPQGQNENCGPDSLTKLCTESNLAEMRGWRVMIWEALSKDWRSSSVISCLLLLPCPVILPRILHVHLRRGLNGTLFANFHVFIALIQV